MKCSLYTYFFDIDDEYVGYSYLSDSYISFPIEQKERVKNILEFPDEIVTNEDAAIYKVLCDKKCLIYDDFKEYDFLMRLHLQFIYRKDLLALTIVPTMGCNCRCPYCYELHPRLETSKMSDDVIKNLKTFVIGKIKTVKNLSISWFGGEPLLCMDLIRDISDFCINLCEKEDVTFYNTITTNGVLLNKKNSDILNGCRINSVQITLDGAKENHDKTRITINGKPTFDIIHNNIINYLDNNFNNNIILRVHVSEGITENGINEITETLNLFERRYREKIIAYPHIIFQACSEMWANQSTKDCELYSNFFESKNLTFSYLVKTIELLSQQIENLGFKLLESKIRFPAACEFETENNWVIRYDGYLTKCTVGIEKERAIAKLTEKGIQLFPERYFKFINKEFSSLLHEHCRDCKYLPFCWQQCHYRHYQNPDFVSFIKTQCKKNMGNWMIKRQMAGLINRYKTEQNSIKNIERIYEGGK